MADDRPISRGPNRRRHGRSRPAECLLYRSEQRRRLENHRLRAHLETHLRRSAHRPDLSTGDGIYKSTDGGKTWRHLGLRNAQQIGAILVHPRDPNLVYVAALGHPYGANEERGVFRSSDGGERWQKVLYKDENTGAIALAFDPKNPKVIYTDLWSARQGPWENGAWQGPGSGLYKTADGG